MVLVLERTVTDVGDAVVLAQGNGLQAVGCDLNSIVDKAHCAVYIAIAGAGVIACAGDGHKAVGNCRQLAVIAEHDVLDTGGFKRTRTQLHQVGGEGQGLDARVQGLVHTVFHQEGIVVHADESAFTDGQICIGSTEVDGIQMALVLERTGTDVFKAVILAQGNGLQAVGSDLNRILDKAHCAVYIAVAGAGVIACAVHFQEAVVNGLQLAVVADHQALDPGRIEGAAVDLGHIGRQDQVNTLVQCGFLALLHQPGIVAHGGESTAADLQFALAGTEVNAGEVGLVLKGTHTDAGQGVVLTQVNAEQRITCRGNRLRGIIQAFGCFPPDKHIQQIIPEANRVGIHTGLTHITVRGQEAVGDLGQQAVVLQGKMLHGDGVERTGLQNLQAGRQRQIGDGGRKIVLCPFALYCKRKGIVTDLLQPGAFLKDDAGEGGTILKAVCTDGFHRIGDGHFLQGLATSKRPVDLHQGRVASPVDLLQIRTILEGTPNGMHIGVILEGYRLQDLSITEGPCDFRNRIALDSSGNE